MIDKNNTIKALAVALATAATITMPFLAEAHWLSSAQEKEIGTQAANDFAAKYPVSHNWVLDHIQKRLMTYNSDKLWAFGTPGKKRGLEPVLIAKNDSANAISYGGGQIYVYEGMFDHLATKESGAFIYDKSYQHPWKKSNIYQMSAMAAVVGHEMGHWENEDMLRQYDRQMDTALIGVILGGIVRNNPWAAFGVKAGTSLINQFNSRDMGFKTEQQADEKAMEYAMYVPEYSVGGEAIVEYRAYNYKIQRGIEDKVTNWLHPHSKTAKRLERALRKIEELSLCFVKYGNDFDPTFNGDTYCGSAFLSSSAKRDFDAVERSFYVLGQIATAIHFDFCKTRCIKIMREDEVFTDGSPNNVVMLLEGHGNDYADHTKIIDTYYNVSIKDARFWAESPWKTIEPMYSAIIKQDSELANLAYTRGIIEQYEKNRASYVHKTVNE